MQELPAAFGAMATYAQFILWEAVPRADVPGKTDKYPINHVTGARSNAHDPAIWITADQALILGAERGLGVGFVFTANDPLFFIDIDDCLGPDGQWSDWATYLCGLFPGAAVEISQSGRGLHIFGSGQAPLGHACKAKDASGAALPFDLYTSGRFAALTGTGATGDAGTDHTAALQAMAAAYLVPGVSASADWTDEPVAEYGGPTDDDELIKRIMRSKSSASVFGGRASVHDLWNANADALGESYPHDQGLQAYDASKADSALCTHLAFWTGKDCERIDRIFRRSDLCRDKWVDREPYRRTTILKAVALCDSVYSPTQPTPDVEAPVSVDSVAVAPGEIRAGYQYLAITAQLEHFKGCVYVRDLHRVFTPDGALLKAEQFKAVYGGYVFAIDSFNDKTSKNAWEVFTESQALMFPRANSTCFRPEVAAGAIIEEEGSTLINTYIPIETERKVGDVGPFLDLLRRIIPSVPDQAILLAYMAALVQHKGSKFQWAPLLQGVQGNGKTIFITCLAHAVGHRYTHLPDAADLGNKFNAWIPGNLFAGIEEIYVPAAKLEIIEALKPMITNSRMGMQGKGTDQVTADNRANFFLCCNPKDALRSNRNDRRYAIFFTAQQCVTDLRRDGMDGNYFPDLYNWLRGGGFAIVNEFLHTYAIPVELNPALDRGGVCHRAPQTTSTTEALALSLGGIEQEVLEAIEEGRAGFAGGWISSKAFDRLLEDRRDDKRIPVNKRRDILVELGYDWHPHLKRGRVNSVIPFDNGKPRLYIRAGHISCNITKPSRIAQAYLEAQGVLSAAVPGAVSAS
jgi:hypothetical protein